MEASRPLLGGERDEHVDGESILRSFECLPRWRASPSAESHTSSSSSSNASNGASHHEHRSHREQRGGRKNTKRLTNGHNSNGSYQKGALFPSGKIDSGSQYAYIHDGEDGAYDRADSDDGDSGGGSACCCFSSRRRRATCAEWPCWKWLVPERIADYDDFATTAQVSCRVVAGNATTDEVVG